MQKQIELKVPKKARRVFNTALKYGVVKAGFSGIDYLRFAIENYGWECTTIDGVKGSAKSNLLLQRGYAIYKDWDTVLEHVVFEPEDFLNLIDERGRKAWIGWDDITVHLPRSLYFTDRDLWAELSQNWAAYRTQLNCFDCTAPRKNRIVSFILEDITADITCFNRYKDVESHYDLQRWLWQRDLHDPKKMFAQALNVENIPFPLTPDSLKISRECKLGKIIIGAVEMEKKDFYTFESSGLVGVPRQVFKVYWDRRVELAVEAGKKLKQLLAKRKPPEPIPQKEKNKAAVLLARARWNKQKI